MPVALERKLKAKVADKKMSKESKDAYVYGTLRKTGWKPEREKKMSNTDKLIRLSQIDHDVDSIIQFKDHDATDVAAGGALALGGVGAYKAHKAIRRTGGYGQFAGELGPGYNVGKAFGGEAGIGQSLGALRKGLSTAPGEAIGTALGTVRAKLGKLFHLKSRDKPIEFAVRGAMVKKFAKRTLGRAYTNPDPVAQSILSRDVSGFKKATRPIVNEQLRTNMPPSRKAFREGLREYGLKPTRAGVMGQMRDMVSDAMRLHRDVPRDVLKSVPHEEMFQEALKRRGIKGGALPSWLFESKDKPIEFGTEILAPWHGNTGHTSKIDQLEFPAGLSPAAALQFPLPVLMHYLNQRNIMQQTFSWKTERLVQLSSKLDEINFETATERFNREHAAFVNSPDFQKHVKDTRSKILKGAAAVGVTGGVALTGAGLYQRGRNLPGGEKRGIGGNLRIGAYATKDRIGEFVKGRAFTSELRKAAKHAK